MSLDGLFKGVNPKVINIEDETKAEMWMVGYAFQVTEHHWKHKPGKAQEMFKDENWVKYCVNHKIAQLYDDSDRLTARSHGIQTPIMFSQIANSTPEKIVMYDAMSDKLPTEWEYKQQEKRTGN